MLTLHRCLMLKLGSNRCGIRHFGTLRIVGQQPGQATSHDLVIQIFATPFALSVPSTNWKFMAQESRLNLEYQLKPHPFFLNYQQKPVRCALTLDTQLQVGVACLLAEMLESMYDHCQVDSPGSDCSLPNGLSGCESSRGPFQASSEAMHDMEGAASGQSVYASLVQHGLEGHHSLLGSACW